MINECCLWYHSLKYEEEDAGDHNEPHSEVEDSRLLSHDDSPITAEFVASWEDLPFPFHARHFHLLDVTRRKRGRRRRKGKCDEVGRMKARGWRGKMVGRAKKGC